MEPGVVVAGMDLDLGSGGREGVSGTRGGFPVKLLSAPSPITTLPANFAPVDCRIRMRLPRLLR
jgi:hypothetical protein